MGRPPLLLPFPLPSLDLPITPDPLPPPQTNVGVDHIWMGPGAKVLYLGAASGTTVSHVADIVGACFSP